MRCCASSPFKASDKSCHAPSASNAGASAGEGTIATMRSGCPVHRSGEPPRQRRSSRWLQISRSRRSRNGNATAGAEARFRDEPAAALSAEGCARQRGCAPYSGRQRVLCVDHGCVLAAVDPGQKLARAHHRPGMCLAHGAQRLHEPAQLVRIERLELTRLRDEILGIDRAMASCGRPAIFIMAVIGTFAS